MSAGYQTSRLYRIRLADDTASNWPTISDATKHEA
jgi:hypothetical protein